MKALKIFLYFQAVQRLGIRSLVGLVAIAGGLEGLLASPTIAQSPAPVPQVSPMSGPGRPIPARPIPARPIPAGGAGQKPLDASYRLGPGDKVHVTIFKLPDYSGDYEVLADGALNLQLVGRVSVQGMTLQQANQALVDRYARVLNYPLITLNLLSSRPLRVGVAGEVRNPGPYTVAIQGTQYPTVTQAIQLAGGTTQSADLRQAQIRRSQGVGKPERAIAVDLWQLLQTGGLTGDVPLRDGDTIFIPTATRVDLAESAQMATANFAADKTQPLNVVVVGEVNRPGPHTVSGAVRAAADTAGTKGATESSSTSTGTSTGLVTVTKALQTAGGIKPLADLRKIQVRRPTKAGVDQMIPVDLWQLLKTGDSRQDIVLQDGDTILVPTATGMAIAEARQMAEASFSPATISVNVVGEVGKAGTVSVQPSTPLNQGIMAAGGFTTKANSRSVTLVRLNPNGSVTKRKIKVNLANEVNEQTNPPLLNNDVIVVQRSTFAVLTDTLSSALGPLSGSLGVFNVLNLLPRGGR
jgi:polysaccharide biosynthesis/export protein